MYRTIKFRGLDKRGVWHYGFFWKAPDKTYYIKEKVNRNHYADFQVIPESLGQFTGVFDKNEKEIYENDIFNCIYHFDGCKKHRFEVVYCDEDGRYVLKSYGICLQPNVSKSIWDMSRQEIIGNSYQNKKLLKL